MLLFKEATRDEDDPVTGKIDFEGLWTAYDFGRGMRIVLHQHVNTAPMIINAKVPPPIKCHFLRVWRR